MTEHFHAIVWIDHHEARVFHFDVDDSERVVVHPKHPTRHIHHKANSNASGHAPEDQDFLHETLQALGNAGAILIAGPGNEKHELVKHIGRHHPQTMARVAAVETMDHPTDGQLIAHARKYFKARDGMHTQRA